MRVFISTIFTYFAWAIPFACFSAGYFLLGTLCSTKTLQTPDILGKSLQSACVILSKYKLAPHIITEKEEPDLPNGTILSQTPNPQTTIKANQSVYIAISKQPAKAVIERFIGKQAQAILNTCSESAIRVKIHQIPNNHFPHTSCIAQYPAPSNIIEIQPIIVYIAKNAPKSVILPNFKGKTVAQITEFLAQYEIAPSISSNYNSYKEDSTITDQRPLAGSIIALNKGIQVQLQV